MRDPQDMPCPAEQDRDLDGVVLGVLLDSPRPLATVEVERTIGSKVSARDALSRLQRSGLVHQLDGFVFASQAGVRAGELASL